MNPTENPSELDQLKKEVASLKGQLRELSQFICINGTMSGKKKLVIVCSSIMLCDPDDEDHTQASIWAGPDGPQIKLFGPNDETRIAIKVDKKEGGSIRLFQPEEQLAIHIGQDDKDLPCVGVLDKGQPRAVMKASEAAGIISAVHNGGQARVTIVGQEAAGEILLVNPDMKVAMKLTTEGQHGGGLFTVNHSNGKAAVIATALPDYGCVLLSDRAGQMKYSLPDPGNI